VSVSPTSSSLQVGQSQQFSASVSGTNNTSVNWLVNGAVGGNSATGTISSSGLYVAPTTAPSGTITVTAQSLVQSSASANAVVSIQQTSNVSVSISPTSASVEVGQSHQFSAVISGTTFTGLNWLVNGVVGGNSSVGTISSSGLYTAPASVPAAAVTVTAQSTAQSTASASASVSITAAPAVSVSISPTSTSVQVDQSQQFSATVSGTTSTGLSWLVNGVVGGNSSVGTISGSGLYTAPASVPAAAVTVTAQSVAQSTAAASARVSITAAPAVVSVSVSPASTSLQVGKSQQFNASVSGTSNTAVNWMVNGGSGGNSSVGTISSSGMYTAPSSVPSTSVTVTAQSVAQTSASGTADVTVMPATVSVSISPINASVQVSQSQQFSATVSGASSTAVNWLVSGIAGGNSSVGTITASGLYTAPAAVPSAAVTVTAQSSASPANSASAAITITQPVAQYVNLSWSPSSSSVAGYNVYRGTQSAGPFTKINSSLETATVYTDNSVTSGQTYYYATTAVNSSGVESSYSNVAQAVVP
jgi:hypothetical protein